MTVTTILQDGPVSVIDYRCSARPGDQPFVEHHDRFTVSYVRKGSFGCRTRGQEFELVAGSLLAGRPGDEYMCTHEHVCSRDDSGAGFGPAGEPALWLYLKKGSTGSGTHVALRARDRAAVDRFHRDGLEAGGRDHGRPGLRADYSPTYYAAFLLDPDGNNVEAVCMQ